MKQEVDVTEVDGRMAEENPEDESVQVTLGEVRMVKSDHLEKSEENVEGTVMGGNLDWTKKYVRAEDFDNTVETY